MNKRISAILLFLCIVVLPTARSQQDSIVSLSDDLTVQGPASLRNTSVQPADSVRKWDFHLSMGATVMGGRNLSASGFSITPTVVLTPNDRLKISASASMIDSYSLYPGGYNLGVRETRSLAPVRNPRAAAAAISIAASYKVNDRLWVAASLMHSSGMLASAALANPWLAGGPVPLDATAFSAAMRYKVGEKSYLDVHLTVVDDRAGTFGPLYFGGPFGGYCGGYGSFYGSAFDNPFGTFSLRGTLGDM